MKHTARPSRPSDQRLARLSLWLALTVAWFAANVLARIAPRAAGRLLTRYARDARTLMVARALKDTTSRARRSSPFPANVHRLTCRRAAGAALRRALRVGTLKERARAICTILAAPERWTAHILRRLQRRFTRLRRLPAPQRSRARVMAHAPRLCDAINSS